MRFGMQMEIISWFLTDSPFMAALMGECIY